MGSMIRKTVMERVVTLLAGPVLLARHVVDLATHPVEAQRNVPETPRIRVVPPEHSVMRRG